MRIFDEDPDIKEEYVQAAKKLNDRGMGKFVQSVEKLKEKENLMEVVVTKEGGESIKEVFRKKACLSAKKKEEYVDVNEDEIESILMEEEDIDEYENNFREKGEDEELNVNGVENCLLS